MSASPSLHTEPTGPWFQDWMRARRDLIDGVRQYELWLAMGIQHVKRRYRRSILGPLWLTLSLGILVAAIGFIYGRFMGVPLDRYLLHVALGFIAWQFIQGVVSDSCTIFVLNKEWITNIRTPLSLFVFQLIWEHLIAFAHNILVYLIIIALLGVQPGLLGILVVPALLLLIANAVWVGLLLGTLCARYRDIPQIIQSLMRVAFFVTPVIWVPDLLGDRAYWAMFNPFAFFVELVRAPLMGEGGGSIPWQPALAITIMGWIVAWPVFSRFRARVPYWL